VEWTNKTVFDEESRLVEIFSVGTDITERRRTENAIRHIVAGVSSEIGAEFFDSITTQFASILGADYTFVAERIEKAGAEFVRTLSLCVEGRISNAAEYPLAGSPCEIALRRGVYSHPSGVKKEFPLDEELAKLDVEAYVGVALTDSSGAQLGVMAALYRSPISDVEFAESILQIFAARAAAEIERKRVEEERVRLAAAIEHAGESILITDPVGRILYANPAYAQTTGYSIPETLGRVAAILRSSEQDQDLYGDLWPEIRKGNVWRGRFENRKKDGAIFQETATISPIKDATGKIVNYVMVGRDVTSEVMLQKQLFHSQKMEAVGALAGGIAHDFNNLLQAILGYAELLLMKKSAADPERAKLEVIQHAARDGADLVSRILTFSRKAESRMRPVDLNEEIRKALKLLKRMVPRMIDIQVVLDDALHIIDADPAQIEQALLNLAVNAHHAMPNGGRLLIETRNVTLGDEYRRNHWNAEPGKYVLLTVSDTGMGIKAENLDRIFEPFFTTKTDGQGTGLGLAMVYGIVSQHAGHIGCYSEPGIGTSFKIYFPVSESELIWDVAATREMPAFGVETILLVDDDARVREMGQEAIRLGGYTVLSARSGEEALQMYAARKQPIDLVILDLIMPGIGGKRCLEELLRMDPDVKALFVSGYSSGGAPLDDEHGGARGFLTKPYTTKDILIAIRTVLDRGRL
jgi:PAS domain S-box-containing protein